MFYKSLHLSKQAIHQLLDRRLRHQELQGYLLPLIVQIRNDHPTLSCRAMYAKLRPTEIGRDRFEQLCKLNGFGIERRVNPFTTTDSRGVIRFDNLLNEAKLTAIDQAWSSDITYYEVGSRFYYITFVLDCFSRRILGAAVSNTLTTEQTTLAALNEAIRIRGGTVPPQMIFHSDGGGQYYDKEFLKLTKQHKIRNSMCEYAWENGKAERLNGIIKNNYLKYYQVRTFSQLQRNVDRAVTLYNTQRPHKKLNYQAPTDFENKALILQ
ncbi:MAG TPA: IS3 family transposase [Chitinophagaceae bacterium]